MRPRQLGREADLASMASQDDLRFEINALRADVASDLITTRKELSEQIVGVRRALVNITHR